MTLTSMLAALGLGGSEDPRVEREIDVKDGYHPDRIVVPAGRPIRLKFRRRELLGCSREVVFPTLGVKQRLEAMTTTIVDLDPHAPGVIPFECGMGMLEGSVVVE
jgi:plastocyanin domain-containing protein